MKKNSLLFVSVVLSSLTLFSVSAKAFSIFDLIEGGIRGIIAGKIYDFIFGEENSNKPDDNIKEKGSEESNNKDNKIDVIDDGEKK